MRRSHALAVLACTVFGIVACSAERVPPKPLQTVKVARSAFLTNAPILLGDRDGYFEREGIKVEYVDQPNNSVQTLPGLDHGDVDVVASVVSIGLINAIGVGASVRIVADRGYLAENACETFGIVGRRSLFGEKPVTAEMLKGRRVATNPVGQSGYLTDLFLRRYGLTLKDVKVVRLPANAEGQAMDDGSLDIVSRGDPFLFGLLRRGHRLLAGAGELSPGTHIAVLVFGPSLLVRDRDLGLRFMRAYLRSVRKYQEGHTPHNVAVISSALGLDSSDVGRMCWPTTREDGSINLASLGDYQKWAVQTGEFSHVVEPAKLVDMEFANRAWETIRSERAAR
jgi:ABC-type nitrate/sulfonate/bicarbonate transport system substrate-binding protein